MTEVESLKYTLCICEGREHDHDVEYLMARTEYIESLSAPSLRNLQSVCRCPENVQNKCYEDPVYSHLLFLHEPSVSVYAVEDRNHGK